MTLGEMIAAGRTSEVFAWGNDSVIKVLRPDVPRHWADLEAILTRAVHTRSVPAPEIREVRTWGGRPAIISERIFGPSMWQMMIDRPTDIAGLARELATVHRHIQSVGVPEGVPDLVFRLCSKVEEASQLCKAEQDEACAIARSLPRGAALLHGDLHPGNVLMGSSGPVLIDWFDAAVGHPIADIVRSSILLAPTADPTHLPGASTEHLMVLRDTYLEEFESELGYATPDLRTWESVIAAARLAEGAQPDVSGLLELWERRTVTVLEPERDRA